MPHHRHGFTLIETLLYIACIGMIMGSMVLLSSTAFTIRNKLRATLIVEQTVHVAVVRMISLITAASAVTTPSLGETGGTLVLQMPIAAQNPTTITSTSGTIYLTQGALGTAQALTSDEVSISSLSFIRSSNTSTASVRIITSGALRNAAASSTTLTVTTTAAVRR